MTDPLQGPEQPDDDIRQVRAALAALDLERHRLVARLEQLQRPAVPVSAVAPAILLSEIEIEKRDKSQDRPPLMPPPTDSGAGR